MAPHTPVLAYLPLTHLPSHTCPHTPGELALSSRLGRAVQLEMQAQAALQEHENQHQGEGGSQGRSCRKTPWAIQICHFVLNRSQGTNQQMPAWEFPETGELEARPSGSSWKSQVPGRVAQLLPGSSGGRADAATRQSQGLPAAARSQEGQGTDSQEGTNPADTMISDFSLQTVRE